MGNVITPKARYAGRRILNAEALLAFDGVDDRVNIGNVPISDTSDWTLECIINASDISSSIPIMGDSLSDGFRLYLNSFDNTIKAQFNDNAGAGTVQLSSDYVDDLIHIHVSFDSTSNEAILRIKGIEEDSATVSISFGVATDFYIGSDSSNAYFVGNVGLVRIFNKALSQQEINQLVKFPYAPPSDLHANIIAEYIPQRSYFKDTGDIYGLGTDAILWFDSVEQYNYAKVTPITANHGVMTGWSDAEVVTEPEPTSVIDFYDISSSLNWTDNGGATEIASGLPPIENALSLNGTSQYLSVSNFNPTKEKGYTYVAIWKNDTATWAPSSLPKFISKRNSIGGRPHILFGALTPFEGNTICVINSVSAAGADDRRVSTTTDLDEFQMSIGRDLPDDISIFINNGESQQTTTEEIHAGFDDADGDLTIGRDDGQSWYFDGHLCYIGIAKGNIPSYQTNKIWNNGNPRYILEDIDWQLLVDFQNPFDDGGTLKFPDLSGNDHDIVINGFANLAAVEAALTPLNELR